MARPRTKIPLSRSQLAAVRSTVFELLAGTETPGEPVGASYLLRVAALQAAAAAGERDDFRVLLLGRDETEVRRTHLFGPSGLESLTADMREHEFAQMRRDGRGLTFANGASLRLAGCSRPADLERLREGGYDALFVDVVEDLPEALYLDLVRAVEQGEKPGRRVLATTRAARDGWIAKRWSSNGVPPERRSFLPLVSAGVPREAVERHRAAAGPVRRRAADRRVYAGDPWAYFRDVLGLVLTDQQEKALEIIERSDRVLIRSANNLGKTFILGAYAVYVMDPVAAVPDPELGLEEQGARILLPGPSHDTVLVTVYAEMMVHAARAEARGYPMPGRRSESSVLWQAGPQWLVEAFSPPPRVSQEIAHNVAGRHQRNQIALIEEGPGLEERIWIAVEGNCSTDGNKIVASGNPGEGSGPMWRREREGGWEVLVLDAFEHPNVRERKLVVPAAVGFLAVDRRVRECEDRGSLAEGAAPDPLYGDFLYALPPLGASEHGPRTDGVRGHPDTPVRVYRPRGMFDPQVRGRYPRASETSLVPAEVWDAAVERWKATGAQGRVPKGPPDRLGVDGAREGEDQTCVAPAWGPDGEALLRAWLDAEAEGNRAEVERLARDGRARIGELEIAPKGDGPEVASWIAERYRLTSWNVDDGSQGVSILDHARHVLDIDASGVSFGGAAPERLPGERYCDNVRTALYERCAMLLLRGLLDMPPDELLRQDFFAHRMIPGRGVVVAEDRSAGTVRVRHPSVLLVAKDEVKKKLGRSPDRSDAVVLAVWRAAARRGKFWMN